MAFKDRIKKALQQGKKEVQAPPTTAESFKQFLATKQQSEPKIFNNATNWMMNSAINQRNANRTARQTATQNVRNAERTVQPVVSTKSDLTGNTTVRQNTQVSDEDLKKMFKQYNPNATDVELDTYVRNAKANGGNTQLMAQATVNSNANNTTKNTVLEATKQNALAETPQLAQEKPYETGEKFVRNKRTGDFELKGTVLKEPQVITDLKKAFSQENAKGWNLFNASSMLYKTVTGGAEAVGETAKDTGVSVLKGIAGMGEGIDDFKNYAYAQMVDWASNLTKNEKGKDDLKSYATDIREEASKSGKWLTNIQEWQDDANKNSALGKKGEQAGEAIGSSIPTMALDVASGGLGKAGQVLSKSGLVGMAISSAGNSLTESYQKRGKLDALAWAKAGIDGATTYGTEEASGLLGKGVTWDNKLATNLNKYIDNSVAKTLTRLNISSMAEGTEEIEEYFANKVTNSLMNTILNFTGDNGARYEGVDSIDMAEAVDNYVMGYISSFLTQGATKIGQIGINSRGSNIKQTIDQMSAQEEANAQKEIEETNLKNTEKSLEKAIKKEKSPDLINYLTEQLNAVKGQIESLNAPAQISEQFKQVLQGRNVQDVIQENMSLSEQVARPVQRAVDLVNDTLESTVERNAQYFKSDADRNKFLNYGKGIQAITKQAGNPVKVLLDTTVGGDGLITINNADGTRAILVNPSMSNQSMEETLVHELFHNVKNTDEFKQIGETLDNFVKKFKVKDSQGNLITLDNAKKQLQERYENYYNAHGLDTSTLDIDEEAHAFLLQKIIGDEKTLNNLTKQQPKIVQAIYDFVDKISMRLKGLDKETANTIIDLRNKLGNALKNNGIEVADTMKMAIPLENQVTIEDAIKEETKKSETVKAYEDFNNRYNQQFEKAKEIIQQQIPGLKMSDIIKQKNSTSSSRIQITTPDGKKISLFYEGDGEFVIGSGEKNALTNQKKGMIGDLSEVIDYIKTDILKQNTNYSLSTDTDNQGRTLSNYVKERTKNVAPQLRDENGNLYLMYHGSPNGEIDELRGGTYFTPNKEYAERYKSTSASSISSGKTENNPRIYEAYLDIKKPFDLSDPQAKEIYINDYIKGGNAIGIDPYLSDAEYDKITNIDWTEVEDLEEFLQDNGYDYDGIIADEGGDGGYGEEVTYRGKSFIPFSEKQIIKANDNNTRYSISGDTVKGKGGTLLVTHALTPDKFKSVLELGGFAMPSMAIENDTSSNAQYGQYLAIFDKDTIDPEKNSNNMVFSRDAYTTRVPKTVNKINREGLRKLAEKLGTSYSYLEANGFEDTTIEQAIENMKTKFGLAKKFADENNISYETVMRDKAMYPQALQDKGVQEFIRDKNITVEGLKENANMFNELAEKMYGDYGKKGTYYESLNKDRAVDRLRDALDRSDFKRSIEDILNNDTTEVDEYYTNRNLEKVVNSQEYEDYIRELVTPVFENKKYIRNDKDYYTKSGNPRSFEQLYDEYNLENVLNAMLSKNETGSEGSVFYNVGEISANASKRFKNISEIKANESKLKTVGDEEYSQIVDAFQKRLSDITDEMITNKRTEVDNPFILRDEVYRTIGEYARKIGKGQKISVDNAMKFFQKNYYTSEITRQDAQNIVDFLNDLDNIPRNYFEAKPRRIVNFDEVKAVLVPKNGDAQLRQQIEDAGMRTVEYDPDIEGDREAKIKSADLDQYRFSVNEKNNNIWNNFLDQVDKQTGEKNRTYFKQGETKAKLPVNAKYSVSTDDYKQQANDLIDKANIPDKDKTSFKDSIKNIEITEQMIPELKDTLKIMEENAKADYDAILDTNRKYSDADEIRKKTYQKYKRQTKAYDNSALQNAMNIIQPNYQGRRTKEQWLQIASQIGTEIADKTNNEVEQIAFRSFLEAQPNQKENLNRQGNKYVSFNSDDWVNTIYTAVKEQRAKPKVEKKVAPAKKEVKAPVKEQVQQAEEFTDRNAQDFDALMSEIDQQPKLPTKRTEQTTLVEEDNKKERRTYKSILESDYQTEEAKKIAKEQLGTDKYTPDSNKSQIDRADAYIEREGIDKAYDRLMSNMDNDTFTYDKKRLLRKSELVGVDDIALGERLMQYYSKTGDAVKLQNVIRAVALAGTEAGRSVQAMSMIRRQTPDGQALWLQRNVDRLNDDLAKRKGGTINRNKDGSYTITNQYGKDITDKVQLFNLTPEMLDKVTKSQTQEELLENVAEVEKELGQQVSKSTIEKLDEWRYFSMLANPKTHIRNMLGNFFMGKTQDLKNFIAGGLEDAVAIFNPKMDRTKTIKLASKEVRDYARNDLNNKEVQTMLEIGSSKYDKPSSIILDNQRTFKSKILESTLGNMFKANSKALEVEDAWGLRSAYRKALQQYMTANKLTPANITDEQLGTARRYAVQQAKEATFHQASTLATTLENISRNGKVGKFFLDALVPFKKTPINVAKTGVAYSPVSVLRAVSTDLVALKQGKITVNQYIDNMTKGLTGSGIAVVGFALARMGLLSASGDDDKDKEYYDELQGKQPYSLKIGDKTYSLDWLAPAGIPLFIGAETYNMTQQRKSENKNVEEKTAFTKALDTFTELANSTAKALNPMAEMSMISGLTDTFSKISQAGTDEGKNFQYLEQLGVNSLSSYVNQYFPTVLGQLARTIDPYERTTVSTKSGTIPKTLDQTKNQVMAKLPGVRQLLPVKTDIWGNEVKAEENVAKKTFNNFLNPATVKKISKDSVDKGLNELFSQTGQTNILPTNFGKKITINGKNYILSGEDYQKYKKEYGQTSHEMLQNMMATEEYNSLNDTEKAQAVTKIYSYVTEKIKLDYAEKKNEEMEMSTSYRTIEELKESGATNQDIVTYMAKYDNIKADYDEEGNVISGSQKNKQTEWLLNSDISDEAKQIIYENRVGNDESYKKFKGNINTYLQFKVDTNKQKNKRTKDTSAGIKQEDKMKAIIKGDYTNKERQQLYDTIVSDDDEVYKALKKTKVNMKEYLKYKEANLKADRVDDGTVDGKAVSGSLKAKKVEYINNMNITYEQKLLLMGKDYKLSTQERSYVANYINGLKMTRKEKLDLYGSLKGFTVYKDGRVTW